MKKKKEKKEKKERKGKGKKEREKENGIGWQGSNTADSVCISICIYAHSK